ncbi:hypothetical protein BH09VER1_BH09VER1_21590 [soil metagenome]
MKDRLFSRSDFGWSAICALISFSVYVWTAAPNVTLGDSGEFLTAAAHFGVPHPTGYPLWTFLAWLFQLLVPIGNIAWQVNLFSGFCGAITVGLTCTLACNSLRWIYGPNSAWPIVAAVSNSLLLAFSVSIWSQATITEVYTMHSLLIALCFGSLYVLIRRPASKLALLAPFFFLTLSFAHHQLTLPLVPLPLLVIILLRRRIFWDLLVAGSLTVLLGYLLFAILSGSHEVLQTAIRFVFCVAAALGILVWVKRGRIRWWLIAFLPFVVGAGMLPYIYLPIAARTNPPMNWGYARDLDGIYYSFNRSQYSGSLSDFSLSSLGKLMGVTASEKIDTVGSAGRTKTGIPRLKEAQTSVQFYWEKMMGSFTPFCVLFYFSTLLLVLRQPLPIRTWIYLLHLGFILAAFVLMLWVGYQVDNASWDLQMPWHAYDYFIFALLSALGAGGCLTWWATRFPRLGWMGYAILLLPVFTFFSNYNECSQRNHWFGWMFGHDMLADLPKGSIMIGGTDPGRFVPTYMIFGESPQPKGSKRDPDFDRRDLYIITQNALGDPHYMNYLRDQYTAERPTPNAFERWLGRDKAYPEARLILPSGEECAELIKQAFAEKAATGKTLEEDNSTLPFSVVLHWIWEKNRDAHDFFIEESFSMTWTYDYATPHGLCYQLHKTKVAKITDEEVRQDFAFWKNYKTKLLSDREFAYDYDAQRSFSKLRVSIANIYRHRKMMKEAEAAYREALELWPANGDALYNLATILWDRGDNDEVIKVLSRALQDDINNISLWRLLNWAEERKKIAGSIRETEDKLSQQPKSGEMLRKLIGLYASVGETNKPKPLIDRALKDFSHDAEMMRFIIGYYSSNNDFTNTLIPARQLTEIDSSNAENFLLLARAYYVNQDKKGFYTNATKAIEIGGLPIRETLEEDPLFAPLQDDPDFKKLVGQRIPATK